MNMQDRNPRSVLKRLLRNTATKRKAAEVQRNVADYKRYLQAVQQQEEDDREKEELVENGNTIQQPVLQEPEVEQYDDEDTEEVVESASDKIKRIFPQADVSSILDRNARKRQQDEQFSNLIKQTASEIYDPQIQELEDKKQKIGQDFSQAANRGMLTVPGFGGSVPSAQLMMYTDELDRLDSQIKRKQQEKDRYISQATLMTDSRQLLQGQLSSIISQSDAFLDQRTKTRNAQDIAKGLRNANSNVINRMFNVPVFGNKDYREAIRKLAEETTKEAELGRQLDQFIGYVDNLGRLPKFDEIPERYKQVAISAFTKDGKFVLDDPEFRKNFEKNNIVLDSEFAKISQIAQNTAQSAHLDPMQLKETKERFQMLEDLDWMENPNIQRGIWESPGNIERRARSNYRAAQRIIDKALDYQRIGEEVKENSESFGGFFRNVGLAHKEFFSDANTYLFDAYNLEDTIAQNSASNKLARGEKLSSSEEAVLQAAQIQNMYKGIVGDFEQTNNGYRWGKISAESLKFMAEFIATGGMRAGMETAGKEIASKLVKKVENKAAARLAETALSNVERYGSNVASKKLLDWGIKYAPKQLYNFTVNTAIPKSTYAAARLVSDATYAAALTNSLGLPKTLLDAYEKSNANVNAGVDLFGNVVVKDAEKGESFGSALWDSERRNWIENFSEMMGEWGIGKALAWTGKQLPGLKNLIKGIEYGYAKDIYKDIQDVARTYLKRGIIKQNSLLSSSALRRVIPAFRNIFNKKLLKAGQFHGFLGEVSEEYYGLILQHLMGVQDDPNKDLWEDVKDLSADIWGGIAVSTGILGAFGIASSIRSQVKFNNAVQNLHNSFGDKAAIEIRKALAFAPEFNVVRALQHLQHYFGEGEVRSSFDTFSDFINGRGVDKKTALAEYANSLLELRGAVYGQDVVSKLMGHNRRDLALRAKELGYSEANYQMLRSMTPVIRAFEEDTELNRKLTDGPDSKTAIEIYNDNNGNIFETIKDINALLRVPQDGSTEVSTEAKEKADDVIYSILAYHNALLYKEGINTRFNDLVEDRVNKMRRQVQLMTNRNTGKIRRLTRLIEKDGKPSGKEILYLVDGSIRTIPGTNFVSSTSSEYGANDTGKVLVANKYGRLRYVDRSMLEKQEWSIDSEEYDPDAIITYQTLKIYNETQLLIDQDYQLLGTTPIAGQNVKFGDKVLTILDSHPVNGITYAIGNEDGSDSQIYRADTYQELQDVVKKQEEDSTNNITKWFKDSAKSLIQNMRTRAENRKNNLAREAYVNETWDDNVDDWEDEDDVVYSEDSYRGKLRRYEAIQDMWDSRAFDDVIPGQDDEEESQSHTIVLEPEPEFEPNPEEQPVIEEEPEPEPEPAPEVTLPPTSRNFTVVPVREPVPTPEPESIQFDEKSQEDAWNELVEDIESAAAAKEAEATGYHYFIDFEGRTRLFKRVHSVKPDAWDILEDKEAEKELANTYKQRILNAVNSSSDVASSLKEEVEKIIKEIDDSEKQQINEKKQSDVRKQIAEYWHEKRMQELRFGLNLNKYVEYAKKYWHAEQLDIAEGLSYILAKSPAHPSVIAGNIYDTIARHLLDSRSSRDLQWDDPRLTFYYYGEQVRISDSVEHPEDGNGTIKWVKQPFVGKEAFEIIKEQLLLIRDYYEKQLKRKLCTDPYTLHAKLQYNGKTIYVAGETDCMAIDQQGRRRIIDFKTVDRTKGYYGLLILNYYNPQEVGIGDKKEKSYSLAMEHAMLLYLYKLLSQSMGHHIESSEVLLLSIEKELRGHRGKVVSISKENVQRSVLTEKGKPNRQVLDDFDGGSYHDEYDKLKKRVTLYTEDLLLQLKNSLSDLTLAVPSEISTIELAAQVEALNNKTKELQNREDPKDNDERNALINEIISHKNQIAITREIIDEQLTKYRHVEHRRLMARDFFSRFQSMGDIGDVVRIEYNSYVEDLERIYGYDIKDLSQEQVNRYVDALIRFQIVINNARELGVLGNDMYTALQNNINTQVSGFLSKVDAVEYFNDAVANNSYSIEDADVEIEERKSDLEYTTLVDHAKTPGFKTLIKSKSKSGKLLTDAILKADFINSAEFYVQRDYSYTGEKPRFELVVVYNNEEYDPVTLNMAHGNDGLLEDAKELYNKLIGLTDTPDKRVRIKNSHISRTFGEFKPSSGRRILTEKELINFVGSGFNDARFEKGGRFGLIKTQKVGNAIYPVVMMPGDSINGKRSIGYVYSRRNTLSNPTPGGLVVLYSPGYEEFADRSLKASQIYVPLNLYSRRFPRKVAALIYDILKGNTSDVEAGSTIEEILSSDFVRNGVKYTGLKNIDVLQMFISYGNHNSLGQKQHIHLEVTGNKIRIVGRISGISLPNDSGDLETSITEFDIDNQKEFIDFLHDNVNMQIFYDNMQSFMEDTGFGSAAKFIFNNTNTKEIVLAPADQEDDGIKITIDDVSGEKITGLGWYLKNGYLLSDFNGLGHPLISIDEKGAIDESYNANPDPTIDPVAANGAVDDQTVDSDSKSLSDSLDDFVSTNASTNGDYRNTGLYGSTQGPVLSVYDHIDEQEARGRIKKILGDIPVEFQDEILGVIRNGRVVAACYKEMLRFSRRAKKGTEYHEAFHRVLELLVSEKTRNRAYKAYRRKFGSNLNDLEIAERAADEFWWYKENMPIKKFSWHFGELLGIIKNWYDFYTKIGSFTLWRLYSSASRGAYANHRPTKEALARWNKLTEENGGFLASTWQLGNKKFDFVANRKEYNAVAETVKYIAMSQRTYNKAGIKRLSSANIGNVKLTVDLIANSPVFYDIVSDINIPKISKLKLMEALGVKYDKQKNAFVKINNYGDDIVRIAYTNIKKYESSANTSDAVQRKQEARGVRLDTLKEDERTGTLGDFGLDDMDLTEQRQFGEFQITSDEINPKDRVTPRVKFFFACVQDQVVEITINNGQPLFEMVTKLNAAGLPQMMNFDTAWGLVLNKVYYCKGFKELYERFAQLKIEDPFFDPIFRAYEGLLKRAFGDDIFDQNGNPLPIKDDDAYGVVSEITAAINHSKNVPMVLQSIQNSKTEEHGIKVMSASMEYTVRETRRNWSAALSSGEGEFVGIDTNGNYFLKNGHTSTDLSNLADWFRRFVDLFSTTAEYDNKKLSPMDITIQYDDKGVKKQRLVVGNDIKSSDTYLYELCRQFIQKLNSVGIGISLEDLLYLLNNLYGHYDPKENTMSKKLTRFCDELGGPIKGQFCKAVEDIGFPRKIGYKKQIKQIWSNSAGSNDWSVFIDAISKGRYHRLCNEYMLSFLTVGGKKQYAMSEPNFITDRVEAMKDPNSKKMARLSNDAYYLYKTTTGQEGSRVFEYLSKDSTKLDRLFIHFIPTPGMKTDAAGSTGIEYLSFSEQEDIVAKYAMLGENYIILPTLADKTTYGGIEFPESFGAFGIDWTLKYAGAGNAGNAAKVRSFLGNNYEVGELIINGRREVFLKFNDKILQQFIKYAKCEYESAKYQLKRYNKLKNTGKAHQLVSNYYGNTQEVVINGEKQKVNVIQGARLSTFTGVFNNGKWISFNLLKRTENGSELYCDEEWCLRQAEKYFFNLNPEQQMLAMRLILSHQVQKTLDYLQNLGMIEYSDGYGYSNKSLDAYKIKRMLFLLSNDTNMSVYPEKGIERSKALVAYVADMVSKELMSHQECYRMFSGNLACYEWRYDADSGKLLDTTTDFFKRVGGMVSTGTHTLIDVPGIPKEINCAEMHNEEIVSPIADNVKEVILEQEFRNALTRLKLNVALITITNSRTNDKHKLLELIRKQVSDTKADDLERELEKALIEEYMRDNSDKSTKDLSELQKSAKDYAEKIIRSIKNVLFGKKGKYSALTNIDVNDGATYISDQCCEWLLKSVGKWNKDIADAFRLLRGSSITRNSGNGDEEVRYSNQQLVELAKAYNLVYTTVIGTQKYTAFGQRMEDGKTAVTYFDKTAYFPIFECMATGHLRAVLRKMNDKKNPVHILKTTSAIKEGSKGAVNLDVNTFKEWDENPESYANFKFNTYKQDFDELRKQFNTDPKEKEYMPLGTQYQKQVLALITADTIVDVDGKELDAYAIRKRIMDAYKGILHANKTTHDKKYYHDGTLDDEAFVDMLQKQIDDRDASDPVRSALAVGEYKYKDRITGEVKLSTRLKVPVSATSANKWIESIVASTINKELVDVTSPGQAFYQRSAWASEGNMSDKLKATVIGEDEWEYTINHGVPLKVINEEKSMDIVLSIDYFDYLFEDHPALKFQSFTTKKNWLIKNGIISGFEAYEHEYTAEVGDVFLTEDKKVIEIKKDSDLLGKQIVAKKWQNAKTNIVGYRIPTQAVSSIHAMRCVDVIPIVRDTIIMPKEITSITGSDFDIDKFFLSTKYYRSVVQEEIKQEIEAKAKELGYNSIAEMQKALSRADAKRKQLLIDGKKEEADALRPFIKQLDELDEKRRKNTYLTDKYDSATDGKKYYLNDLIDMQIKLLTTTDNNIAQLHGSIDSDTLPLKEIAKKLQKNNPVQEVEAFDASSLRTNVVAKLSFAIGKRGIGPYALNNNNHVFTMLYGVKFVHQPGGILDTLNLEDLSRSVDRNGRSILSWLSGLINAHVDVAKDPYIRSLGVNQYTYNLVSLLIRTGYGEQTFWFTTQPIMKEFYSAYDSAAGVYNLDETSSQYYRTEAEITNIFLDKVRSIAKHNAKTKNDGINAVNTYLKNKYKTVSDVNTLIKASMNEDAGVRVLEQIACTPKEQLQDKYDIGIGELVDYDDIQLLIAVVNFKLQEKALDLSHLVQYTKIDTKKHGKTVIEQDAYLQQFHKLLDAKKSPFLWEGINDMLTNSFIKDKTEVSILAMRDMLSSLVIEATPGFLKIVSAVKSVLNSSRTDEDFMTSISKMIVAKLKADYFFRGSNSYCAKRGTGTTSLLSGSTSIYSQLIKIKTGVSNLSNHEYDSIRDENGNCNNYLINNLIAHVFVTANDLTRTDDNTSLEDLDYLLQATQDDWMNAQFIKSQNILDDAIKSADMQNAWLDLLNNSENTELLEFAEKLVVYAFITSAATGGKFDLFKYVPPQWMSGECDRLAKTLNEEDTFASYIYSLLLALNSDQGLPIFSLQEIDEMVLNFSYDDNIVKEQSLKKIQQLPRVDSADGQTPLLFAGVYGIESGVPSSAYTEEEYPTFIKVPSNTSVASYGQRKYNIYKCISMGQVTTDSGDSVRFPIYALVKPQGGVYYQGQKIYSIDLQTTTNDDADFQSIWYNSLESILHYVYELGYTQDQFIDPASVFMELLGLRNSNLDISKVQGIISMYDERVSTSNGQLAAILQYAENARIAKGNSNFDLYDSRQARYTLNGGTAIPEVDFEQSATDLHVELIDDRYSPMDLSSENDRKLLVSAFGSDIFEKIDKIPYHLEFYKKRFTAENGKLYFDVTITVSAINGKARGWFEVLNNIRIENGKTFTTNEYSVHFKTYSPKMGSDTKNASVPLSERLKKGYMLTLLRLLPEGALVSTQGSLSKGGLHLLNNLSEYVFSTDKEDVYVQKVGTRQAKLKGDEEPIEIPVWEKTKYAKGKYEGNLSVDSRDYDKFMVPTYNVQKALSDESLTQDVQNALRSKFAEEMDKSTSMTPTLALINILNLNLNIKRAIINSGNEILNVFLTPGMNNELMSIRSVFQLQEGSEETEQECAVPNKN